MKFKNLIPLLVILAILAGLVAYKKAAKETPTLLEQAGLVALMPDGVSKADIVKLELYQGAKPDEKLVLAYDAEADKWRVTTHFNAPVKKDTIDKYLDALVKLKGEPRTMGAADKDLEQYELADGNAFHVTGFKKDGAEPFFHVLAGKVADYRTVFMRKADSKDVFVESTNLKQQAGIYDSQPRPGEKETPEEPKKPEPGTWLDKDILKLDTAKIMKLAVNMPDKALVLEKREKIPPPAESPAMPPAAPEDSSAAPAPAPAAAALTVTPPPAAPVAAPPAAPVAAPPVAPAVPPPAPAPPAAGSGEPEKPSDPAAAPSVVAPPEEPKKEYEWVLASGGPGGVLKQKGVDSLLQKFATLAATDIVDPAKKAEYGLEPPMYKCVVSVEGQDDVVIEGGRPDPAKDGYIRVAGAKEDIVYSLSKYTFEQLFPKATELFDLPGLVLNKKDIQGVNITQPSGNVSVAKLNDQWNVMAPQSQLKVQTTSLDTLATTVSAWKPVDYADSDAALGEPVRVAEINAGAQTHTITLFADSKHLDGAYVKLDDNPKVLVMSRTDINKVFLAPKDLFDRELWTLEQENIAEVHASGPLSAFDLVLEGENWKMTVGGAVSDAQQEACETLLAAVADLQADDIRLGQADVSAAESTLRVKMKDGVEHTLSLGPDKDGSHEVKATGKAEVFTLKHAGVVELFPAADTLKKLAPAPAPVEPPAPPVDTVAPAPIATQTVVVSPDASSAVTPPQVVMVPTPPEPAAAPPAPPPAPAADTVAAPAAPPAQ